MLQDKMFAFAMMGGEWVLWLLVGLSALCIAVAVDRGLYRRLNTTALDKLQGAIGSFIEGGSKEELQESLAPLKGAEARVLRAGLDAVEKGGIPAAEEAIAGHIIFEKMRMDRGLIIIGTTGSNAPFIGLFGTVLGIIKAFHELSLETAEAATSVMAGISEALVATAIGLMVAIPAVVLYNYFQRMNKSQFSNLESMGHLVLSRLNSSGEG